MSLNDADLEAPKVVDDLDADLPPENEGGDAGGVKEDDKPQEPDELFTFEGDEPADADAPTDGELAKRLREEIRKRDRELAALRKPAEDPGPGPRPTLESVGWDEEALVEAVEAWTEKKNAAKAKETEAQKAVEAQQQAWAGRVTSFQAKAQAIRLPEGKTFEGAVQSVLDHFQPGVGMDALKAAIVYADDPRLVVALESSPATVEKIKALGNDALAIGVAIGELKGKIKTVKRDAPTPDRGIRGGTPPSPSGPDKHLAKLEADADRTGDRSKVIAYRRELKRKAEEASQR